MVDDPGISAKLSQSVYQISADVTDYRRRLFLKNYPLPDYATFITLIDMNVKHVLPDIIPKVAEAQPHRLMDPGHLLIEGLTPARSHRH